MANASLKEPQVRTVEQLTGLGGDYVSSWDSFVGQADTVLNLKISTKSAKRRGVPLGHIFFSGAAGLGKTQLATLCAMEMGRNVTCISGPMDANRFRILLSDMEDGDIINWEEFHSAVVGGQAKTIHLLNYLQDGVTTGPNGVLEEAPQVTIIATTTEPGKLNDALLSRFDRMELVEYTPDEAVDVAFSWVDRVLTPENLPYPSGENVVGVAVAAAGNPRAMGRIFRKLRDVAIATDLGNWDAKAGTYDLSSTLRLMGITEDGLTRTMQRYLVALMKDFGGVAGEKPLMDKLNEPGGLRPVENVLCAKGYVVKTNGGRQLSREGMQRAKALQKAGIK